MDTNTEDTETVSGGKARTTPRQKADSSNWAQKEAVTGRPVDVTPDNSTFAQRAASKKAVKEEDAEDKSVTKATSK